MPGVEVPVSVVATPPALAPPKRPACTKHSKGDQYLVLENGRFAYLSVPPQFTTSTMAAKLCFMDHRRDPWDPLSLCCLQEGGHVHAHVHHGEITEDVFLEQCLEEAGCALPMPWDISGSICKPVSPRDSDHEHSEGCGHNQIAHGDHYDWLIPLKDGSFMLSHAQRTENGGSRFIEHGRLVKVGETLGRLKRRPKQLIDLFSYESPNRKGYESLPHSEMSSKFKEAEMAKRINCKLLDHVNCKLSSSDCRKNRSLVYDDNNVMVNILGTSKNTGFGKTTLDVMGICCPNEVPLIKKLLGPIPGVEEVSVNVTSKTVTVLHDLFLVSDMQLVKTLNEARLDASVHRRGEWKAGKKWPSPWTMASGFLLGLSFFQYLYHPLKWVALGSVAVGIPPLILRSFAALKSLILDINILMLIAVGGAIGLGDYLEAGSIAFLFTLADWLESRSSDKARAALAAVVDLAPRTAVLLGNGVRVRVEDVKVGTILSVKAGEMVPIDGTVMSGKCNVDESSLTGESMPVEKDVGSNVWAGTVNMSGHMTVRSTALSEDSTVARMVRLVEEAQSQRSHTELLVEQIAKYYTPGIVVAAIIIAVVPWALHVHQHRHWLYLALVLLVVACPCALVISTPVVTTCGIAQAAKLGLLIKGGSYLEVLGRLKVVALDKTGTLSEGHFRVTDMLAVDGVSNVQHILHWVACVENKASHPMAAALVSFARLHGVEATSEVRDFEVIVGEGVTAKVDGHTIHIGNARMATHLGWQKAIGQEIVETWNNSGATVGWIGVDKVAVGVYSVADQLRKEAVEAVKELKWTNLLCIASARCIAITGSEKDSSSSLSCMMGGMNLCFGSTETTMRPLCARPESLHFVYSCKFGPWSQKLGIRAAMLTGDSASAASFAHKRIGEIEIHSQLLPEDKVRVVQELKKFGVTAMVGDGINDGPALAAADVGIAMGVAGSAVAMETADVALMTNDLRKLAVAVQLGKSCRWKISQNVTLSFVTKLVIIGLAAAGYASLWTAVLADVGTCLLVIFNSMRLLKHKASSDQCCTKKKVVKGPGHHHAHQKCETKCCSKGGVLDMKCLESKLGELCDDAMAAVPLPHAQRGKFHWLQGHRGHPHTHGLNHYDLEKRHEAERLGYTPSCSKTSFAETKTLPCCSSSRCEQGILTPRGAGSRHPSHHSHEDKISHQHSSGRGCCSKGALNVHKPKASLACCSRLTTGPSDDVFLRNPLISSASCDNLKELPGVMKCAISECGHEHLQHGIEHEHGNLSTCCERTFFNGVPIEGIRRRPLGLKENQCSAETCAGSNSPQGGLAALSSLDIMGKPEGQTVDLEPSPIQCCGKSHATQYHGDSHKSSSTSSTPPSRCCADESCKETTSGLMFSASESVLSIGIPPKQYNSTEESKPLGVPQAKSSNSSPMLSCRSNGRESTPRCCGRDHHREAESGTLKGISNTIIFQGLRQSAGAGSLGNSIGGSTVSPLTDRSNSVPCFGNQHSADSTLGPNHRSF